MSNTAIQVENLSKKYRIGRRQEQHDTLRDAMAGAVNGLRRKSQHDHKQETIWALNDISFNLTHGQAVGIIGRNGAGKSTLLKILSQITEPTSGRAVINGRVGSLLEVGTGFHPELTGRENIYLNGAILGMSRKEISKKFDEIVTFAEIEKFLDTPVKRYSSGMFVRLGFSVAAHLEPDILLVDEVLAVGDTEFQKRCLGKMDDITSEGRTILFVSHNMNVIQRLCKSTILLDKGSIKSISDTSEVIKTYIQRGLNDDQPAKWIELSNKRSREIHEKSAHFSQVWYSSHNPELSYLPYPDGQLEIRLKIDSDKLRVINSIAVSFYDRYGSKLVNVDTISLGEQIKLSPGENVISLKIDKLHLNPGLYNLGLWLANPPHNIFDHLSEAVQVEVVNIEGLKLGKAPDSDGSVTCDFTVMQE